MDEHIGRARPQQSRSRANYDKVVDAAERLFAANGVQGTKMTVLAQEAGLSVSSLYHLFKDRDEVAEALAVRYATKLMTGQQPVAVHDLSELEAAIDTLVNLESEQHDSPGYTALLLDAAPLNDSAVLKTIRDGQIDSFVAELTDLVDCDEEELRRVVTNGVDVGRLLIMRVHAAQASDPTQLQHIKLMIMHYVCGLLRPGQPVDWRPVGPGDPSVG